MNLAKPDEAIFRLPAERIGLPVEDCFFIDDAHPNVVAAREVGMSAYHFVGTDYTGLQEALRVSGYRWS